MDPKDSTETDKAQARRSTFIPIRCESGPCPWCGRQVRNQVTQDGKRWCVHCDREFYVVGLNTWGTHPILADEIAEAMLGREVEE